MNAPKAVARQIFQGNAHRTAVLIGRLGRALALTWAVAPRALVALVSLTVVASTLPAAMAWVGKTIVNLVAQAQANVSPNSAADSLVQWIEVEFGLVAALATIERIVVWLRLLVSRRLTIEVNTRILQKAAQLDLHHLENPEFYDRLSRARGEAGFRPLLLVQDSLSGIYAVVTLISVTALLSQSSPWAVGILLASVPVLATEVWFTQQEFRRQTSLSQEKRRLNYLESVLATDRYAQENRLLDSGPLLLEKYRLLANSIFSGDMRLADRRALSGTVLSFLATAIFYVGYASIALDAAFGTLSIGDLTLMIVVFRQAQQSLQGLIATTTSIYGHGIFLENLFGFLDLAPAPRVRSSLNGTAPHRGIRFEDVGFRYPGASGWALRHVTLAIAPGTSLALVGENGAGKSTFIKLITRLYSPTEGRILVDGKDLENWDPIALQRRMAVVLQDFNRYQFTLAENVGIGDIPRMDDREAVKSAIARSSRSRFADALPAGIDTQLGRLFDGGAELSGGQWQQVAISRAFFREDADILILDEPTAALDASAEREIFDRVRSLMKRNRVAVLISHRFGSIMAADQIAVLRRGVIIECGNHAGLLQQDGEYARLFRIQAVPFQPTS